MKIEVLQCDECGVITDDIEDKDWVCFSETDDHYCKDCASKLVKNPLNTGYGIICGNSETPSLSVLAGYAVKCRLSEDSRYYLMEGEASFLPDGIAVNCIVAIDEKTYDLIKPKNAVIESFLRNNFPDDFEF
jgi:hypothetical protein